MVIKSLELYLQMALGSPHFKTLINTYTKGGNSLQWLTLSLPLVPYFQVCSPEQVPKDWLRQEKGSQLSSPWQ